MLTTIPRLGLIAKVALGAGGAGLLALGALGTSTPVLAASSPATAAAPAAGKHHDNRQDRRQDRRQIARVVFDAEASVLGIKPEELRSALRSGKKVSDLANDKGMSQQQFGERVAAAAKPGLDKLVDGKQITADQAQRVEKGLDAGHVPFWNGLHRRTA